MPSHPNLVQVNVEDVEQQMATEFLLRKILQGKTDDVDCDEEVEEANGNVPTSAAVPLQLKAGKMAIAAGLASPRCSMA